VTPRELLDRAEALLVDLDGTLVDSTAPVRRAWDAFAARHELDPDAVYTFAQGRPTRESIRLLLPDADHDRETALVDRAELDDTAGIAALPGAAELLGGSRRLAIVTSGSRQLATLRLARAGLPIPRVLVTSDDVAEGKPNPACFLLGARLLDVEPARCVVLEDSPAGVLAGRATGATVIALRTTHPDDELRDADAVVDDLAALLGLALR
jgi:mannitol-1-/sugar-/sorbitol-6-phosphatase